MPYTHLYLSGLPKKITTAILCASFLFAGTTATAYASNSAAQDYLKPNDEDIKTFSRPLAVPQGENNIATPARIELGKHLFFDPRLSGSNSISCATCHNPALGWSDSQATAIGDRMQVLERATPTIINTGYQRVQFWDGRASTLEEQALGPIVAAVEMNQPLYELFGELKEIPGYVKMFEVAYPGEGINAITIGKAIAAFERTIIAGESDFDRWLKGDTNAMSAEARRGFLVFAGKGNCTACHTRHNFTDDKFHNIGLKNVTNLGRFAIEPDEKLKGAFKTPTLRDIARTAPYMHNGAYKTLEEVVEHYNSGGFKNSGTPSEDMKKLNLSDKDKKALVTFMKSLTGEQIKISVPVLPVK